MLDLSEPTAERTSMDRRRVLASVSSRRSCQLSRLWRRVSGGVSSSSSGALRSSPVCVASITTAAP